MHVTHAMISVTATSCQIKIKVRVTVKSQWAKQPFVLKVRVAHTAFAQGLQYDICDNIHTRRAVPCRARVWALPNDLRRLCYHIMKAQRWWCCCPQLMTSALDYGKKYSRVFSGTLHKRTCWPKRRCAIFNTADIFLCLSFFRRFCQILPSVFCGYRATKIKGRFVSGINYPTTRGKTGNFEPTEKFTESLLIYVSYSTKSQELVVVFRSTTQSWQKFAMDENLGGLELLELSPLVSIQRSAVCCIPH